MQQTFIPLCQALHISSDPYWYWDACFDSQKDWAKILEWEDRRWEMEWRAAVRKRNKELAEASMESHEHDGRTGTLFGLWEAQVRGRLEGMTVCNQS